MIQEISKAVGHIIDYQRTPVYAYPLRNGPIEGEEKDYIKSHAAELVARSRLSYLGFLHHNDPRAALEVSPAQRHAHFEAVWQARGFSTWHVNFHATFASLEANEPYAELRARRSANVSRLRMLRTSCEAYNRSNVELVDLRDTPIECITATGVQNGALAVNHRRLRRLSTKMCRSCTARLRGFRVRALAQAPLLGRCRYISAALRA